MSPVRYFRLMDKDVIQKTTEFYEKYCKTRKAFGKYLKARFKDMKFDPKKHTVWTTMDGKASAIELPEHCHIDDFPFMKYSRKINDSAISPNKNTELGRIEAKEWSKFDLNVYDTDTIKQLGFDSIQIDSPDYMLRPRTFVFENSIVVVTSYFPPTKCKYKELSYGQVLSLEEKYL